MKTLEAVFYLVAIVTMLRIGRASMNLSKLCVVVTQKLSPKKEQDDVNEVANRVG
jgi:hypothetical protein